MSRSGDITEWISGCSKHLKRAYISFWGSFHNYRLPMVILIRPMRST